MAATALLTPPHSPRTYVVCPSIAADSTYQPFPQKRQKTAIYLLLCCSNPSTWSELDQTHLPNVYQHWFLLSTIRRVLLHLEREGSAKHRGQKNNISSEYGAA